MSFVKGVIPWNKGKKGINKNYKNCGFQKGNTFGKLKKGFRHSDETKKKISLAQMGKVGGFLGKHHTESSKEKMSLTRLNGRKRKRRDERNDSSYTYFVKQVKKRDKGKCKMANNDCMGYYIVHHILPWRDYPEERYNINNGITLCQFHHPRKRIDEQRFIPFFQSMVEIK